MIRAGIVGLSPGNGHPFSFSAIVNGYDDAAFERAGWPVIHDYLSKRDPSEFGIEGVRMTHAWTQDPESTRRLCAACRIDRACDRIEELLDAVDAVVLARDDWETHASIALPALRAGKRVFVDKPLTLEPDEMESFRPFLESGTLMSTSGLRYARELDEAPRTGLRLVQGVVLLDLERYGIHLLEAVAGLGLGAPVRATRLATPHPAFLFELAGGTPFTLHCLGDVARTFSLHLFGQAEHARFDLHDNFSAFRRTLETFFGMCRSGRPPIPPAQTLQLLAALIVARRLGPGESVRIAPAETAPCL